MDEPDIANMGADWSHEVELRATVDRTKFEQLDRIRVKCRLTNVSGVNHAWLPPLHPLDHYLRARVRVFDKRGMLVPMTNFYKHEGRQRIFVVSSAGSMISVSGTSLNPGDEYQMEVIPNLVYDMTRPGEYWILVEIPVGDHFPHNGDDRHLLTIRAQPIKVIVKPDTMNNASSIPRMIPHSARNAPPKNASKASSGPAGDREKRAKSRDR